MNKLYKGLAVLGVAILLAPVAQAADDVPNFNKRGDNEKFVLDIVPGRARPVSYISSPRRRTRRIASPRRSDIAA